MEKFRKKSKFSRIWAIFGPKCERATGKWAKVGKKLEKIGLKIVKNVCPNGLEFWAFWGYFFVIFFNFWPKYSLLGRLEWVRLKRVGKIKKKLSNLGILQSKGGKMCNFFAPIFANFFG